MDELDISLFRRVVAGDHEAFRTVYDRYHAILYTLALTMLKDRAEASDTVQWVFARLWEYRSGIIVHESLRNYLYTMTKHCILNRIQHNNTAVRANYRYAQHRPEWENATSQKIERDERLQRLEQAICTLPLQKQQVVQLKRSGLSNEEIAERLHVSIHTIKSHYQESIKLLRARLRDLAVILLFIILNARG